MVEAARGDVKPGEEMLQLPLALMETFARAPMPSWAKRRLMPVVASLFQACLWLEKLKEPEHDGYLHAFVKSTCFEAFTAIVILFNAIEAAAAADYEMLSLGTGQNQFIFYSELAMCIFYTVELVLKLRLHGVFFFINEDRVWNFFDLILVVQSMYEQIAIFLLSGGGASLSFMRTFRIMKVVKAFRAIRFIRMFRELRLMMVSLKNSFGSLFWTMIMLVFIFYIFGLIAMQGVSNYLMAEPAVSQEMAEAMLRNFGTMQKSMLTMYKTGTGGADWEAFYDILEQAGTFYAVTYLFFTCFFHISVFNVLTGMFVERVMKLAEPDHDQNVMEWRKERQAQQYEVKKLCKLMDSDNSGTISWEEFEGHLSDERVSAYFASLELDIKHAEMFFHTLVEANDGDEVDIDSFVEGCMQMKGTATSIDLHIVSVQIRNLHRHVKELTQFVADELGAHRPAWNFALGAQRCSRSQARAMENVELWDTDSLTKTMFEPGIHHGSCWRVTEDEAVVQPPVLEEELDWKAGGPYCASAERLAALSESAVFS